MEGWNIDAPIEANGDEEKQIPKRVGPADQADENDRKERSAENEDPRPVAVGEIAHAGLDDEGEHPHHSGDQADLGQGQREPVDEDRQERIDEGDIEIARKMGQGQGEDDFDIGGGSRFFRWGLLLLRVTSVFLPSAYRGDRRPQLPPGMFLSVLVRSRKRQEEYHGVYARCQFDSKPPSAASRGKSF